MIRSAALALALALPLLAAPVAAAEDDPTIVVTGRSLAETRAALAACIARGCPPDQEIAAAIEHGENQFLGGDYKDARATLLGSLERNRRHGKSYPVPVSDLLRANSRVAEHLGEAKNFQLSVLDMRDVLKSALGGDDPRALVAQIEVGDSRAKLGYGDEALDIYREVGKRAAAAGQPRVASFARLREALLHQVTFEQNGGEPRRRKARAILDELAAAGDGEFATIARVMAARMDRKAGDSRSTETMLAEFAARGGTARPVLLSSEPIPRIDLSENDRNGLAPANTLARLTALNPQRTWADIGFLIGPDGRVDEIEVLRSEGGERWLKPVLKHLKSRQYAPPRAVADGSSPGFYQIERYSLTARWTEDATGTNLRRREPTARIERLDITPETAGGPAGGSDGAA